MNKNIFLSFLAFLPLYVIAEDIEINEITYRIVEKAKVAEVTSGSNSENIVIPDKINYKNEEYMVTGIAPGAFRDKKQLRSIILPSSILSIGDDAFFGCENLSSLEFPSQLTQICRSVCNSCSNLISVKIGKNVKTIDSGAFNGCDKLQRVIIEDVSAWCDIDFYIHNTWSDQHDISNPLLLAHKLYLKDEEIKDLVIPEGTKNIKAGAFEGCNNLISITFPKTLEFVDRYSFWLDCEPERINISDIESYCKINFVDNPLSLAHHLYLNGEEVTEVDIPSSIEYLMGTFWGASSLKRVTIPSSVRNIDNTFNGCSALEFINIPLSITDIGNNTFRGCKKLKEVAIPDKVKYIGNGAFEGCGDLEKVSLGKSIIRIGYSCFAECPNIKDFYCYSEYPPNVYRIELGDVFWGSDVNYSTLYVPYNSLNRYKNSSIWSVFGNIKSIDENTKKCDNPSIEYNNGVISFKCNTEGAKFYSTLTNPDIHSYEVSSITLTATYTIKVHARAEGYLDSDEVTATLCWINTEPQIKEITNNVANINAKPLLIKTYENTISIFGISEETIIEIYNLSGIKVGEGKCRNGVAQITTNLQTGDIAVVKIKSKNLKIIMK